MNRVLDTYERAFFTNNPIGHRPDLIMQSQEGLTCKQRCVRNRHGTWLTGVAFGLIAAIVGGAFCVTQNPKLLVPGVALSLSGVFVFLTSLLFAGIAESFASDRPGLPPPQTIYNDASSHDAPPPPPPNESESDDGDNSNELQSIVF